MLRTRASLSYHIAIIFTVRLACIQALDYTHRKDDGTVERFADSAKAEFKTKGGRKVYDGGGLDPDVKVEDEYVGAITTALINGGYVICVRI